MPLRDGATCGAPDELVLDVAAVLACLARITDLRPGDERLRLTADEGAVLAERVADAVVGYMRERDVARSRAASAGRAGAPGPIVH